MNHSIFKSLMTIDSGHSFEKPCCNFLLKCYTRILLRQLTKILNQLLNLSRANENLENCMPVLFERLNESKQF